jgi:hypothetical protein
MAKLKRFEANRSKGILNLHKDERDGDTMVESAIICINFNRGVPHFYP